MKTVIKYSSFFFFLLFLTSCEKVIPLKLKNAEERLVIEGILTKGDSIHVVKITKTLNFDQTTNYPIVEDAIVNVSDDNGNIGSFAYIGNGVYQVQNYPITVGRTYTLTILQNGKTFEAKSTVPSEVLLNDVQVMDVPMGPMSIKYAIPMWTDIAGEKNYYKYDLFINGEFQKGIFLQDDTYSDGLNNEEPIEYYNLKSGDTLTVEMNCVDYSVYQYFFTLNQNTGSTAAPANPVSNFGNDALGYFSARVTSKKTILIP